MSLLESAIYRAIGVRPESDGIKWYSVLFFELFAQYDNFRNHTIYDGVLLPTDGPILFVGNHTSMFDTAKGYRIAQRSGRIPRTFTRESLLDPTKLEPTSVLERTGRKKDLLNSSPIWVRRIIAALPAGVEAIPVSRGGGRKESSELLQRVRDQLNARRLVALFVQETRNKEGKLTNLMRGAGLLARNNPDVPIFPVGITVRKPHRATVGEPFTYNQMIIDPKFAELARTNFIVLLGDRISELLDEPEKIDWHEVQRPILLAPKRKIP